VGRGGGGGKACVKIRCYEALNSSSRWTRRSVSTCPVLALLATASSHVSNFTMALRPRGRRRGLTTTTATTTTKTTTKTTTTTTARSLNGYRFSSKTRYAFLLIHVDTGGGGGGGRRGRLGEGPRSCRYAPRHRDIRDNGNWRLYLPTDFSALDFYRYERAGVE
jgi:hypothetical protein